MRVDCVDDLHSGKVIDTDAFQGNSELFPCFLCFGDGVDSGVKNIVTIDAHRHGPSNSRVTRRLLWVRELRYLM